jgi:fructokinase
MMATPKWGWSEVSLLEPLQRAFDVPIALDTDVAGAALAEWQMGAGRGTGSLAYVTVGTGIGGAVVPVNSAATRLMHAEMGHLPVRRDARDLDFSGVCPFHGDCLEGLASGPAIRARWGCTLESLAPEHPAWTIIGGYLAQLAAAIALMFSVEKIVFGGGVLSNGALLPHIGAATFEYLNGYLQSLNEAGRAAGYICGPALGRDAGITGALLMAAKFAEQRVPGILDSARDAGV